MHAGVPVVASDVPSAGGAARRVNAGDTDSIAEGLIAVANDDAVREQLIVAGRKRVAGLTWVATADAHVAVWRDLW
jgi:glycosyltransferase involved in cell wall biosynthesis